MAGESVSELIAALGKDSFFRLQAAQELGARRASEAVGALLECLTDPFPQVRVAVINALVAIGDRGMVPVLLQRLAAGDSREQTAAAVILGRLRAPEAVDPLMTHLEDPNVWLRIYSAGSLRQIGDPRTLEPAQAVLLKCLAEPDLSTRQAAARILAETGDRRLVPVFLQRLERGDCPERDACAVALGMLRAVEAVDELIACLKDEHASLRSAAAVALGNIGDPTAFEPLVAALDDRDKSTRVGAIYGLARLDRREAIEAIVPCLVDKESDVSSAAAKALDAIDPGWEGSEEAERALPELVRRCDMSIQDMSKVLARFDNATVFEVYSWLLRSGDQESRMAAAFWLADLEDARLVNEWIELLSHKHVLARSFAEKAIEKIQAANAEFLATYPDVVCTACNAPGEKRRAKLGLFKRLDYVVCSRCGRSGHLAKAAGL
ncbi:MAG TPA: HEAT repeat domain-containing protein [Planctomycetota bacterium]|nr:HEAT repeat domain-containing protein [Planctomycetota bacterium]